MSVRSVLSLLLVIWLFLSIARLTFDLIGKLWIAAIFDLLQIVCCITGLFGSLQKRRFLLYALLISNAISIVQNVLIFLWYIGIFGEISRPVLSAGLPYSFSFFLRFTPACQSHFDLKRTIWVQHNCLVPFYSIEASQAVLHVVFAIATTIFSILMLLETKKKPIRSNSQSINHYAQICGSKIGNVPTSINGSSSGGYGNSNYDDLRSQGSARDKVEERARREREKERDVQGQFERNSKRKRGKNRPNSMPAPDMAPCSSSKSSEEDIDQDGNVEDVYTKPIKKKSITKRVENEEEVGRRSATVTSLVSFDPKSATLLRIRQHLEAESEDRGEISDFDAQDLYERLRSRSSGSDIAPPATSISTIPLSDYKPRNASQDSVPSIFAPMLNSPATSSSSSNTTILEPSPSRIGISLVNPPSSSPGIRLSDQLGASKAKSVGATPYKSAFRVQSKDTRVIGHYHAPNEIPLSSDPSIAGSTTTSSHNNNNYPVITSNGLLV